METIGQRLKRLRTEKKLTQAQLASAAGLSSQSSIGNIESDTRGYGASILKIADILEVTPDYLVTGIDKHQTLSSNISPGPDIKGKGKYPVISLVQAGQWTGCQPVEAWEASEWRISHHDLGPHGYFLRVRGQSMTAPNGQYSFPDGMLLHVNPQIEATPGRFVIAARQKAEEATFKRLAMLDGELWLEALNPDWPNRFIKLEPNDRIVGVVVDASFGTLP